MKKSKLFINKFDSFENILLILFLVFPIAILAGNLLINLITLTISSIFFLFLITGKTNLYFKDKIFILLVFLFITLLINLAFSNNYLLSLPRILKIFFIIFFIFSFKYLLKTLHYEKSDLIYKFWSLIFLVVTFDLIIEFFSGKNVIGLESLMPGSRLGSFTGKESIIGNYFYGFVLIFLAYFYSKFPNKKYLNLFLAFSLIGISFLIGERSNFIKTFIIIILFSFLVYDIKFKFKLLSILLIFIVGLSFLNFNKQYKTRYINQLSEIYKLNGIKQFLKNSQYGAHYNVAYEIFKRNPVFGIGIKNFRIESFKKDYNNLEHSRNDIRGATHPHQIHYEFLSETGLFGYVSFLLFIFLSLYYSIKSYFNEKNIYQLAGILFVISSLVPILPSGSFFSTYTSSIFWINYSIMVAYINIKNIKF